MMIQLGPHAAFIVTAYAAAIAIVAGLIAWILLDRRHLTRMIDDFEAQGIMRRSQRGDEGK
jgi:heme exporter protein D